jgi:hypothetical protein
MWINNFTNETLEFFEAQFDTFAHNSAATPAMQISLWATIISVIVFHWDLFISLFTWRSKIPTPPVEALMNKQAKPFTPRRLKVTTNNCEENHIFCAPVANSVLQLCSCNLEATKSRIIVFECF